MEEQKLLPATAGEMMSYLLAFLCGSAALGILLYGIGLSPRFFPGHAPLAYLPLLLVSFVVLMTVGCVAAIGADRHQCRRTEEARKAGRSPGRRLASKHPLENL